MIKVLAAVFMSVMLILCFIGCGNESDKLNLKITGSESADTEAISEQNSSLENYDMLTDSAKQDNSFDAAEIGQEGLDQGYNDPYFGKIDVDLTQMSSTMVFSEVSNMMSYAEDYVGKVIRAEGEFSAYTDEATGITYCNVIIADATACCSQGLEFVWNGEHSFPDDYPPVGSQIIITGVFNTFVESGITFCQILCDDVRPA